MDVLGDILSGIKAAGSVYFCDFLRPPWQLDYRAEERALFHLVRRGRCQVEVLGRTEQLEAGDFVFIAPGVDHTVSPQRPDDSETLLLCGYCQFEAVANDVLLRALPEFVLMRGEEMIEWPWLLRTLEHLSAEYMSKAPGSALTVDKLTEVLLVQLLRADFGRNGASGVIAALQDPRIATALTAVHKNPAHSWTIESAAAEASLSRSGFARKFTALLGMGFFDYLTRLRMRRARELLKTTSLTVSRISEQVGYQSDLSFVKAFKRLHGKTPRGFRIGG
ncbi:MAG: AraC-like DNA-binding protein [Lysobacterales bacterium]|jgi:AraC-like DNA-binding protein